MRDAHRRTWLLALIALACGGEGLPQDEIDSTSQSIINGTPFNPEGLYYVAVHHGGPGNTSTTRPYNICSGTLVRNDAVLTARHCVTYDRTIGGVVDGNLHDFELLIGSQRSGVREIVDLGSDVAVIIAQRFFTMHTRNVGWKVPLYASPSSTLLGRELFCFGYGVNSTTADPATAGILRYAWLAPNLETSFQLEYPTNASGQGMYKGDSGGSCIYTGHLGTALEVTGVNSTCSTSAGPCQQIKPEVFRAGLTATLADRGAAFLHRATSANTSAHITTIDHPDTNDRPGALVSVTPNWSPPGHANVYNNRHIGAYYHSGRWRIFNQGIAAMPIGASFNVSVGAGFVHRATTANTSAHVTTLDDPRLNGNPNAAFIVTPNWNPPGFAGVYNDHPIGVWYNASRWKVFNQDLAAMPNGASFTVRIDRSVSVRATSSTVSGNTLYLDDPNLNGRPEAQLFVTPNYNPGGTGGRYLNSPIGVWYSSGLGRWAIFRQDGSAMPNDAGFNVLARP
ncbi:MAG: trypsin-like serine protease [Polyangiaceae bacterium]|nr:trypsin-like serine protease [Polyangiaceae bacterium]